MAVVISKEQVLLALVLEIKEYFSKYLQLEDTLFEGFESTVLFFPILTVDAALLSPKVLSHLSELKRMFGMTHLIVFGYFACDLEKATIELVVSVLFISLCGYIYTCSALPCIYSAFTCCHQLGLVKISVRNAPSFMSYKGRCLVSILISFIH